MPRSPESSRRYERTILLLLFVLFLFASPFTNWWAAELKLWYLPYLLWLLVILIGAWLHFRFKNHDV